MSSREDRHLPKAPEEEYTAWSDIRLDLGASTTMLASAPFDLV